jgi:hypothetical protein
MSVVAFSPQQSGPSITLVSGETFNVLKVALYPANEVSKIASKRMQAQKNLGGVSTGIGFWGSPTWVLEGMLVLGAIENSLSNSAAKEGVKQLEIAREMYLAQMDRPQLFDVHEIENLKLATPTLWRVVEERKIDLTNLGGWTKKTERDAILDRNKKSKSDIVDGWLTVEDVWLHNGDEFVLIETDSGTKNVRWSQVATVNF